MKIDLLDPASFSAGHPFAQYRWLRENAPVFWHEDPHGPGFWAVTRFKDVYDVDRNFQAFSSEPTIMIMDPPPDQQANFGGYKMMLMMDPPQHTAYRKLIRQEFTVGPRGGTRAAHAIAGAPDRRCGDRARRMRFRGRGGRRDAVLRDRRTDGPAAGRRPRTLQADRDHPHRARSAATACGRRSRAQDVRIWPRRDRGEARAARRTISRPSCCRPKSTASGWTISNSCCSSCCWSMRAATRRAICCRQASLRCWRTPISSPG